MKKEDAITSPGALKFYEAKQARRRKRHRKRYQETYGKPYPETTGKPNKKWSRSMESRQKQSMTIQGITNPAEWGGFASKKRYCWKWWDRKLKIRKRVRAFFKNTCVECGAHTADRRQRFLHVNHVGNDKDACCKENPKGWLFVTLCSGCHRKASGKYQKMADKKYTELIMTKYDGKCYYTLEEFNELVFLGELNSDDYGSRDGH